MTSNGVTAVIMRYYYYAELL